MASRSFNDETVLLAYHLALMNTSLDSLYIAYEAARSTTETNLKEIYRQFDKLKDDKSYFCDNIQDAGLIEGLKQDEMSFLADSVDVNANTIALIRESFTIALAHLWERGLNKMTKSSVYNEQASCTFLTNSGLNPDVNELKALRLCSNVAKHSGGRSAEDLYKMRPAMFASHKIALFKKPGYESLELTDDMLVTFFHSVKQSLQKK